jgi:hypothetical protein
MNLTPAMVYEVASFYHHFDILREGESPPPALTVRVCDSISCRMAGSEALLESLERNADGGFRIQRVPCVGHCAHAPVAVVGQNPVHQADPEQVMQVVEAGDHAASVPEGIGIGEYLDQGGYRILQRLRQGALDPETVLRTLEDSGLRGLGGAGFPAGRKWRIVRSHVGPRLLVVNIDEGEPGTFKDRHYLERDPHRLIEGMLIAAAVVDCEAVYIYLRDEYAGCRRLLERELAALRKHPVCTGLVLPEIHLRRGAGAYICGEESALVESIDLPATFIEVAGGKVPDHIVEGRSLLPFLHGETPDNWRDYAISEYDYSTSPMAAELGVTPRDARLFMVTDQRWKFIHAEGGFRPMLFDLANDPDEFTDLGDCADHADIIALMYERLGKWGRRMSQRVTVSDGQIEAGRSGGKQVGILIGVYAPDEVPPAASGKYRGPVPTREKD